MRRRAKRKVLNEYPWCAYCGGNERATTIDHVPSRGMFVGRKRPPGLFIPSCEVCNRKSSVLDDFAALLGAIRLNPSVGEMQHFSEKVRATANNNPEILNELMPQEMRWRAWPIYTDVQSVVPATWKVDGPIVSKLALQFGAKCALALHFKKRGFALTPHGRIGVVWSTNAQILEQDVPQQLFELLPQRRSLGHGKDNSYGKFEYSSGAVVDGDATAHWVTFGNTFMYHLFAGSNLPALKRIDQESVFSPGFLKTL